MHVPQLGTRAQPQNRTVLYVRSDPHEKLLTLRKRPGSRVAVRAVLPLARARRVVRHAHGLTPAADQPLPAGRVVPPLVVATTTNPGRLNACWVAHRARA